MIIQLGDRKQIQAVTKSIINVEVYDEKQWNKNHLSDVLYVPGLEYNLFSVSATSDKGFELLVDDKKCLLKKKEVTEAVGEREGGLYVMEVKVIKPTTQQENALLGKIKIDNIQSWHEKLVHQHYQHVKKFLKREGIESTGRGEKCVDC